MKIKNIKWERVNTIVLNRTVMYPTILQFFSALAPLLFFRFIFKEFSTAEVIIVELLLVINAFSSVLTNWSSTLFISRVWFRFACSGAISTLLYNRSIIIIIIYLLFSLSADTIDIVPVNLEFRLAVMMILLSQLFDASWYFIGQKKLYILQLQLILQYSSALILIYFNNPVLFSVASSWLLITFLFFISIIFNVKFARVKFSLSRLLFRRFLPPTISDVTTSLFSKLDVVYAAILLPPEVTLVYILFRKHILAIQSIIFASIRLLYLERNDRHLQDIETLIKLYIVAACTLGILLVHYSITIFFAYKMTSVETLILILFGTGIPLGYLKLKSQLQDAYKKGKYRLDLFATVVACFIYLICVTVYSSIYTDMLVWLVFARVCTDLTYISILYVLQLKVVSMRLEK